MKDKIINTINYYDNNADNFFADTVEADMSFCIEKFVKHVYENDIKIESPQDILLLDAGCGSGRDTKTFLKMGFNVEAFDASREIAKRASAYTGINVKQLSFDEFSEKNKYDGIWACASLLHVKRDNLISILKKFRGGLKVQGVMYASFKYGNTERIKEERFFSDMNEEMARKYFHVAGFTIDELFITGDVREDRGQEKWINVIAKKKQEQAE